MLGAVSEADDAVQEAWLRLSRTDSSNVADLGAWLTDRGGARVHEHVGVAQAEAEQKLKDLLERSRTNTS
jgi:DNA-directed RNA polymerase specialized sigma24 family protein